jgi:hypothetical protein
VVMSIAVAVVVVAEIISSILYIVCIRSHYTCS